MKHLLCLVLLVVLCTLVACKEQTADALLGKWTGPEGTFLEIEKAGEDYTVTVQNLDGPRTFPAKTNSAGVITFDRDGTTHAITTGNGEESGMKWLADKKDCIVVIKDEGYCRD